MGYESIGQVGGFGDARWDAAIAEMAIVYLTQKCGKPPLGCKIEIVDQDHDLGTYSMLALTWDSPGTIDEREGRYVRKCELALENFQESINWDQFVSTLPLHESKSLTERGKTAADEVHQQIMEKGMENLRRAAAAAKKKPLPPEPPMPGRQSTKPDLRQPSHSEQADQLSLRIHENLRKRRS